MPTLQHAVHRGAGSLAAEFTDRQQATIDAILDAGADLVRTEGYDTLTIRAAALHAGVTHTTAYTYFSSKAHLVAEIFWRRLQAIPRPTCSPTATLCDGVVAALGAPGVMLENEPALAQASLTALLSTDDEVRRVRDLVGEDLALRLQEALGSNIDQGVPEALLLAFNGAMLQAGMGYFDFAGVVERVADVARLIER